MGTRNNVYGEGNYEATRDYNDATKRFVNSGKVEEAARAAAPRSPQEAEEMRAAEQAGRERAKDGAKKSRPPIEEPQQDPAIEDPLPEDAAGNAGPRH